MNSMYTIRLTEKEKQILEKLKTSLKVQTKAGVFHYLLSKAIDGDTSDSVTNELKKTKESIYTLYEYIKLIDKKWQLYLNKSLQ